MSPWTPDAPGPYAEYLGLRFGDTGEVRLTVRPELVNTVGRLLGPIALALCDYAMGDTVWATIKEGEGAVTMNVAVNFLSSSDAGEVVARGRLERRGRTIAYTSAQIHDEQGKLLVTAMGTFAIAQHVPRG